MTSALVASWRKRLALRLPCLPLCCSAAVRRLGSYASDGAGLMTSALVVSCWKRLALCLPVRGACLSSSAAVRRLGSYASNGAGLMTSALVVSCWKHSTCGYAVLSLVVNRRRRKPIGFVTSFYSTDRKANICSDLLLSRSASMINFRSVTLLQKKIKISSPVFN